VDVTGGEPETLASFGRSRPRELALHGTDLLFLIDAFDSKPPIAALPQVGGALRRFGAGSLDLMTVAGDWIFGADYRGRLFRLKLPAGTEERLADLDGYPRVLAVDRAALYTMIQSSDDRSPWAQLVRVPREGGPPRALAQLPVATGAAAVSDGLYLLSVESQDCRRLRAESKKVRGGLLGICDPATWALRHIVIQQ
jgi:hypothetical protein